MKNNLTKFCGVILCFAFVISLSGASAQTYDAVSIGPGYTNQSFYSLANNEISNISNTDWDLAFQVTGFQATVLVNGKNNVRLFKAGLDINAWSSITVNDTIGMMNPGNELLNQDTSWWAGAFNITNDIANQFDLGWGVYDFATHVVTGDSLYFIKLSSGDVKKLWLQSLQNNTYYFTYADLDGTNEVNASLSKQNFTGKNFGYYSIVNGVEIDREPNKYLWDITFEQYMATTPFVYKVTGVLSNDSVQAVKAFPVDVATVSPWGYTFSYYTSTIGYDWKTYDFGTNGWVIEDSTVYFVYDRPGNLWKLWFTGFGGSATGDYEFYKQQISATGLEENSGKPSLLNVYPNPAAASLNILCFINEENDANHATIFDINGKRLLETSLQGYSGLKEVNLNTSSLDNGIYVLRLTVDGLTTSTKFSVSK